MVPDPEATRPTRRLRPPEALALAALVLLVGSVHAVWILNDAAPMPHPLDPYAYLMRATRLLAAQGTLDWLTGLQGLSVLGRAPLYQLLALPFLCVGGPSVAAALMLNVAFWVVLLVATWGIGRKLGGPVAGLVAAAVAAAYPPLIHLSHVFRPHFAAAACTAVCVWLLLLMVERRTPHAAWAFGASCGFALLVHPTVAWTLGLPTAGVGIALALFATPPRLPGRPAAAPTWLGAKLRDPFVWAGLLPAGVLALAPVLLWYGTLGAELVESAGRLAADERSYAVGFPLVAPDSRWYLRTLAGALSTPLAVLGAVGVAWAVVPRRWPPRVVVASLVTGVAVLSFSWLRAWWYAAAVLPLLAALTGAWVARLRPAWLAGVATLACVAAAGFVFVFVLYAPPSWSAAAVALGSPLGTPSCANLRPAAFCPGPVRPEPWPALEILEALRRHEPDCGTAGDPCVLLLAQPHHRDPGPVIGRGLFAYTWASAWPRTAFQAHDVHMGLCGDIHLPHADYILRVEAQEGRQAICFEAWSDVLDRPPLYLAANLRVVDSFELPAGRRATLFQVVRPWTRPELDRLRHRLRKARDAQTPKLTFGASASGAEEARGPRPAP